MNNLILSRNIPYAPLNAITLLFSQDNWCTNTFLLKDINPAKIFLGSFFIVFINVSFNPAISSSEMHKSIIKKIPLSPTLASTYSSTALLPTYDKSWFIAPQKLQLQVLACLFLGAKGFNAALQTLHIGGVTLIGLTWVIKGE